MAAIGYFGKIPSARDFVFQGLPTRTTVTWADHMAGWLTAGRTAHENWKTRFLISPVWRFVLPGGLAGPHGWVGLLAGSVDEVGREFPFTVMIESDIDPATRQPIDTLDPLFDRVEGPMLEFIEGQTDHATLTRAIEAADAALRRSAALAPGNGDARLALPAGNEDALCISGGRGDHSERVYAWSPSTGSAAPAGVCLWWHDGGPGRAPDVCVTRGIPRPECIPPFFLADWQRYGWTPRDRNER